MNENTVTDWRALLDGDHRALRGAVIGVAPAEWSRPTPCEDWSVTQVLQHAAGDQIGYAAPITDGPWPTEDPFAPSGHIDEDPLAYVDRALEISARAWTKVGDDAPEVPTPLPQGPMPAWLSAGACALDAAVHAWDIAVATGQRSPLSPGMARQLMIVATRIVPPLRGYGAYAPELDAGSDADDVTMLLCFLGRRPRERPITADHDRAAITCRVPAGHGGHAEAVPPRPGGPVDRQCRAVVGLLPPPGRGVARRGFE
ncbi:TIGR03086 family metal-binding protein [Actinomadura sp. HBU206391]|uniref:TIGR03086 family metal-binding protein n=1 Tax=Actinomadura sp. HBU206391 TaxID=2731692 RepID=UPI00164F1A6C|nr:TIGR03086 family metal-binding protein [Actinomadura sp. HBU206391]MBC6456541.1 TIGR03086 family protein [Actinomadura sp. HBU206391]